MPTNDYYAYLWEKFCEFYPPWKEHVETWEQVKDEDTIIVKMKDDDYITSGYTYIFGDEGCGNWHLERRKADDH